MKENKMNKLLENLMEEDNYREEAETIVDAEIANVVSEFLHTTNLDTLSEIYQELFHENFREEIVNKVLDDGSPEQIQALYDKWIRNIDSIPKDEKGDPSTEYSRPVGQ